MLNASSLPFYIVFATTFCGVATCAKNDDGGDADNTIRATADKINAQADTIKNLEQTTGFVSIHAHYEASPNEYSDSEERPVFKQLVLDSQTLAAGNPLARGDRVVDTATNVQGRVREAVSKQIFTIAWDNHSQSQIVYGLEAYAIQKLFPSPLPTVTVSHQPHRVEWIPTLLDRFPEQLAQLDQPVVLTNTIADAWPAQQWTPEMLTKRLKQLTGVKSVARREQGNTPFFYFHGSPMSGLETVDEYKARTYTKVNMSAEAFFTAWADETSDPAVGYAAYVDELGLAMAQDVQPIEPLMVWQPQFELNQSHLYRQTRLWFSGAKTVTPAHFDLFHNCFVQLSGRKRFLLFPPAQWQQLYPWPLLHPGGRSAQVDLDGDVEELKAKFSNFDPERVRAVMVTLEPGQVLYVPPLWFHHVTTLEPSLSVSVWTQTPAIEIAAKAVEDVPLPIKKSWSQQQRVLALRIVIESLVASLKMDIYLAEFVHWTLLENRYAHLPPSNQELETDMLPYCDDAEETSDLLVEAEELFRTHLKVVVRIFKDVRQQAGEARLVVELANYIELASHTIVGTENVKALLYALVNC